MPVPEHGGASEAGVQVHLDFSLNLNPYGMPPSILAALAQNLESFAHYPDPSCRELRAKLAKHEGLEADQILCGNGSADLIFRLVFALRPRRALLVAPCFSEYEHALRLVNCDIRYHYLREADQFALTDRVLPELTDEVDLLILCNPNNPTGRLIQEEVLEKILQICEAQKIFLLLDECFIEFTKSQSLASHLGEYRHLFVLKAFTKSYAMAGLRLGYLLGQDQNLLQKIASMAQHWSVSVPAQVGGLAALEDYHFIERARKWLETERPRLMTALSQLGLTVFPSDANFILFKAETALYEALLRRKILLRSCANFLGLSGDFYRIAIKLHTENQQLIQALKEILHG